MKLVCTLCCALLAGLGATGPLHAQTRHHPKDMSLKAYEEFLASLPRQIEQALAEATAPKQREIDRVAEAYKKGRRVEILVRKGGGYTKVQGRFRGLTGTGAYDRVDLGGRQLLLNDVHPDDRKLLILGNDPVEAEQERARLEAELEEIKKRKEADVREHLHNQAGYTPTFFAQTVKLGDRYRWLKDLGHQRARLDVAVPQLDTSEFVEFAFRQMPELRCSMVVLMGGKPIFATPLKADGVPEEQLLDGVTFKVFAEDFGERSASTVVYRDLAVLVAKKDLGSWQMVPGKLGRVERTVEEVRYPFVLNVPKGNVTNHSDSLYNRHVELAKAGAAYLQRVAEREQQIAQMDEAERQRREEEARRKAEAAAIRARMAARMAQNMRKMREGMSWQRGRYRNTEATTDFSVNQHLMANPDYTPIFLAPTTLGRGGDRLQVLDFTLFHEPPESKFPADNRERLVKRNVEVFRVGLRYLELTDASPEQIAEAKQEGDRLYGRWTGEVKAESPIEERPPEEMGPDGEPLPPTGAPPEEDDDQKKSEPPEFPGLDTQFRVQYALTLSNNNADRVLLKPKVTFVFNDDSTTTAYTHTFDVTAGWFGAAVASAPVTLEQLLVGLKHVEYSVELVDD